MQIENAEQDAAKLPLVPSHLGDLISLAQAEIEDLCTSHEFECTQNTVSFSLSSCGASVHLYPAQAIHSSTHTASVFAASAMGQFEDKVTGTGTAVKKRRNEEENVDGKKENDAGDDGFSSNISEYVDILIEEARSVDNLARMFEGWMPWV